MFIALGIGGGWWPKEIITTRLSGCRGQRVPPQLLPDPDAVALAQVHATLALADQLARVAEALEVLVEMQQEMEASPAVADQIERVADVLTTLVHVQQAC